MNARIERGVETGVVHEDVDATVSLEASETMRSTSSSDETSAWIHSGGSEVHDHDLRPLGEPAAIAAPIPCAPPVTIATLP